MLVLGLQAAAADGQDPAQTPSPPHFARHKDPLPKEILEKKSEGWYVTGFPMIGVDPEIGPVLGAQAQIFDNGSRTSPFFTYAPYRRQIQVGAQISTDGEFGNIFLSYDQPYIDDSPWRLRGYAAFLENKNRRYFGTGEETLEPLHYPGSPESFRHYQHFKDAIESTAGGVTWSKYVSYQQRLYVGALNLEYDLLGGYLRPLVGVQISHYGVTDYSYRTIDGAMEQETKLAEDNRLGRIRGVDGGWDNSLRVGLAYDTRDYEPDPTRGILAQMFVSGAMRPLGSEFNYGQATFGVTGYRPIISGYERLILVGNATYAVRFGDVPFYAMNRLALPRDEAKTGLGSFPTLRGYRSNRFVGDVTVGADVEVRWSFADFYVFDQHLKTALAPFFDTGRVFDSVGSFSWQDWKYSYGVGLRLAWNLATVISFDYGFGPEGSLFFMEVGHPF